MEVACRKHLQNYLRHSPIVGKFGPGLEVMEEKALKYMEMRGWHGRWAWEDGSGGKGKKATKTHAARAFGKKALRIVYNHVKGLKYRI